MRPISAGPRTMIDTRAERAFLAALQGGCQVPIGAVVARAEGRAVLHGFIGDIQGTKIIRGELALDSSDPEASGAALARDLRARGATQILDALNRTPNVPAPQPE